MGSSRVITATATGAVNQDGASAGRPGSLLSVVICAGADAATVTVRDNGASGNILCKLGAGVGLSDSHTFASGPEFSDLHITVTGTTPTVSLEVL